MNIDTTTQSVGRLTAGLAALALAGSTLFAAGTASADHSTGDGGSSVSQAPGDIDERVALLKREMYHAWAHGPR